MLNSQPATANNIIQTGLSHRFYQSDSQYKTKKIVFVLVHGRAGNEQVMWVFSKAFAEFKPLTVSPQAPFVDHDKGGFSWWDVHKKIADQDKAGKKAVLMPAVIAIEKFIDSLSDAYNQEIEEIYAIGFSQGAGLLSTHSLIKPNLFSGVALLSGFIPRVIEEQAAEICQEDKVFRPDYFIFHGSKDEVLPIEGAYSAKHTLESLGANVTFAEDEVGHKVSSSGIKALQEWCHAMLNNHA